MLACRSQTDIPTLVSSEYDAEGLDVCVQPVSGDVFPDDLERGIEYSSRELPLAWHCPPSNSFLPVSPEISMGSQASAEADDVELPEPSEPFSGLLPLSPFSHAPSPLHCNITKKRT